MLAKDEIPPTRTVQPIDRPPESDAPTTAQLKADINSGATGDKTEVFDPGLSPLGTDDEAAGTPAGPQRTRLARFMETRQRWSLRGAKAAYAHRHLPGLEWAYAGFGAAVAVILVVGIVAVRA